MVNPDNSNENQRRAAIAEALDTHATLSAFLRQMELEGLDWGEQRLLEQVKLSVELSLELARRLRMVARA